MNYKTIFISHAPIPNPNIASWTNRYTKLIRENTANFDYIIAPKGLECIDNIKYTYIKEPSLFTYKIAKIIPYYKHKVYWKVLKKIIAKDGNVTIHIIDNPNILFAIEYYTRRSNLKNRIQVIFHMCGYVYNFTEFQKAIFYTAIDLLIVQTIASVNFQKEEIKNGSCEVVQLYNGIDGETFFRISNKQKLILRDAKEIAHQKMVFLWVSQDRPKKGLAIILEAWSELVKTMINIELLVIGAAKTKEIKNVTWLGKIQNNELPAYYQLADFYLFSTQCNEGFGLTLGEALKCGITCLASDIDPMDEILNHGMYGRLIKESSNSKSWELAIQQEVEKYTNNNLKNVYLKNIPESVYDYKDWSDEMINVIS